jgi:hypothetical protein
MVSPVADTANHNATSGCVAAWPEAWRQFFVDLANLPPPPPPLVGDGLAKTLVQTSYSIWHGRDGLVDLFNSDFIPFLLNGPF